LGNGHLNIRHWHAQMILGVCLATLVGACSQPPKEPSKAATVELVPREKQPIFDDDLDPQSLRTAIERSLDFFDRLPASQTSPLGEIELSREVLKNSLLHFLELLDGNRLNAASVAESFDVYRVGGDKNAEQSLVTGYYEPVVAGRLEQDSSFCYPLYGVPPDLLTIELASFDPVRFPGERLVGRLQGSRVVPYYTRAEIDGGKKLEPYRCQLAWLRDPVEAFFLHVQGSGIIQLPDGRSLRIGYAAANGRPYRSVGKVLIDRGVVSREEMSLQAIRAYLRHHPEDRDGVMWHNESYVFFRWIAEGPLGSLNVPLTPGRSLATDPRYHPRGALAYLETRNPRTDASGHIIDGEPLRRWVLNQDTGGAIKGPGRADLFWGTGDEAEEQAGRMKHPGKLYFLIKKGESTNLPK
jgi:membrane-bound lytic murein transglycosylase A